MTIVAGVRDKGNFLIGWFESVEDAESFIKRYDPNGEKGYHVIAA